MNLCQVWIKDLQSLSKCLIKGVYRTLSLGCCNFVSIAYFYFNSSCGCWYTGINRMFTNDFKVFKFKKWFILTKDFSNKKFKSTVSTFKLITLIFKFFEFFNYLASFRRMFFNSRSIFCITERTVVLPATSEVRNFLSLPTISGLICSKLLLSLLTPSMCIPPLWAKAHFPTKGSLIESWKLAIFTDFPCCMGQHFNIFHQGYIIVQFHL